MKIYINDVEYPINSVSEETRLIDGVKTTVKQINILNGTEAMYIELCKLDFTARIDCKVIFDDGSIEIISASGISNIRRQITSTMGVNIVITLLTD